MSILTSENKKILSTCQIMINEQNIVNNIHYVRDVSSSDVIGLDLKKYKEKYTHEITPPSDFTMFKVLYTMLKYLMQSLNAGIENIDEVFLRYDFHKEEFFFNLIVKEESDYILMLSASSSKGNHVEKKEALKLLSKSETRKKKQKSLLGLKEYTFKCVLDNEGGYHYKPLQLDSQTYDLLENYVCFIDIYKEDFKKMFNIRQDINNNIKEVMIAIEYDQDFNEYTQFMGVKNRMGSHYDNVIDNMLLVNKAEDNIDAYLDEVLLSYDLMISTLSLQNPNKISAKKKL